jgi:predicted GH43/DUF377 family glycosyl hydrolase
MTRVKKSKILLKPKDIKPSSNKFEVLGVFNPGAARLRDGNIILYVRIIERLKKFEDSKYYYSPRMIGKEKFKIRIDKFRKSSAQGWDDFAVMFKGDTKRLSYISHLRRVILDKKGFKVLKLEQKPGFWGLKDGAELGVEDPRITEIEGKYYMTYVGLSRHEGISTYIAESSDCLRWKRKGIIFGHQDKDVVLFPEKIKGRYVAFDRPEGSFRFIHPHIWIAYSKDLEYWGKLKGIVLAKRRSEFSRSGAGPPPIKTDKGWLLIFHAVTRIHPKGFMIGIKRALGMHIEEGPEVYASWGALFEKDNPRKLISRSYSPVLVPGKKDVSFEDKRVVFPTGIVKDLNGKDILLYCGSGDRFVSVKKIELRDIMNGLRKV